MALPLWLATLNPGGKTKRRRRRTLTAWQREVKRAGGVMQAVKARRSRKHSKRRRRNPFLTVAKSAGAFAANAPRRKRRKHATRRSAVSRRILRGRSRRATRRRPKMARVRHRRRRTPPRGAGGRFKSRHSRRSRRHRRNPVVPVSWNPRRKRRRSRRRNPLYLTRKGRFSGRGGRRRLHMRRRAPRHWHNNPVVPVSWNPKRRRSSRRRYRNNPVLPFFAMNPAQDVGGIVNRVKSMIDVSFWTETGVPATVGFFGSKALGQMVYNYIPVTLLTTVPAVQPFFLAGTQALSGAGLAWAAGKFLGKKQGDAVWLGTVVNVSYTLIQTLLNTYAPGMAASIGMSGMGDDVSSRLKDAVTKRVQASLSGYLTVGKLKTNTARPLHGSYMTVDSLSRKTSYSPATRMSMGENDVANDSTEL
jgi:hypothetical protein